MPDVEAPLTPGERLLIVSLYASLTVSLNRSSSGLSDSETLCYADLNICRPRTLSHKRIPESPLSGGFRTGEAC